MVAYSGNGVSGQQIKHNLGVPPELTLIKNRGTSNNWLALFYAGQLANSDGWQSSSAFSDASSYMSSTFPNEATYFGVSANGNAGASGNNYIAYLFATVAGVSKVGSYTGSSSGVVTVDCGFTSGARFVLIKRTDASGDWYVYDSVRGINSSADDPYLLLNTIDAESTNTNNIEPHSSGFQLTQQGTNPISINGGSYIFYAIA